MIVSRNPPEPHGWNSVGRWTLFGTLGVTLVAVTFNFVMFRDMGTEALSRSILSAIILPVLLGMPLFFYMSMRVRGLVILNRRLGLVARTDSLTACLNRGAFTAKVEALLGDAERPPNGALLMIDADNFKAINDVHGHIAGDEALTIIARSIRGVLRAGDLVGRMGGEEFAVFLPGVNQDQAEHIAERVRYSVNRAMFAPAGLHCPLSVSIGGAAFERTTNFAELFRIADHRLYGAKQSGRNRSKIVHVDDHPAIELKQSA